MRKTDYSLDDVIKAVEESKSLASVIRYLGLRPSGGNYKTIHRIVTLNSIDVSHFTGQGWNVGLSFRPNLSLPDKEVFSKESSYKCSWRLRERYKKITGKSQCDCCGLSEWMGEQIPLEIHHINGVNTDNRLDNLQLLCPNCHAQTDHYRGRAKLSALSERREVECRKFKEALTGNADGNLEPSLKFEEGAETRHDTPKCKKHTVKE